MRPHSSPDKTVYILHTYDANGMRTSRTNGTTAYNYVYNGGSLSQMTVSGNTLNFAYDASGMPMMVTYNGTNYYYIVNLQGDVKGIVDSTGTLVVYYTYDAWGKPLSVTGSMADTLGTLNPLRYRSYVYDSETGYYYLQSRYYDPEISRFINADGYVSTGQGFIGNNMFAYCNNNPVNLLDPTGTVCCAIFGDNQLLHLNMQVYFSRGGGSYASGGISGKGHYISMKEFLDTDDPEVVFANLDTHGIAYYNGVLVLQVNFGNGGGLSYGIILLDNDYTYNDEGINALNHEYGHKLHMDDIGIINYTVTTAFPSLLHAGLYSFQLVENYFSLPWERTADMYGGVDRHDYTPWSKVNAVAFWITTRYLSELTGGI